MKRWLMVLTAAAALAPAAQAQTVGSYPWRNPSTPTVSPYLNLNRGGSAGINYFSLVRPQLDTQKNFAQLNQELMQMQLQSGAMATTGSSTGFATGMGPSSGFTGQESSPAVFNSLGHYFPMMPQGGVGSIGRR
ncbi:MAG: hypothetical protein U0793_26160 [Gemmataceae bacterium]